MLVPGRFYRVKKDNKFFQGTICRFESMVGPDKNIAQLIVSEHTDSTGMLRTTFICAHPQFLETDKVIQDTGFNK